MKLTYIGPKKQHTFNFPIPYVSKGECEGEIICDRDKEVDIKDDWAVQLLAHVPHLFKKPEPLKAQKG